MTKTPILQFGTSRFLQAHADLFVSEAMQSGNAQTGEALGPITVVKTSASAERESRLAGLTAEGGYRVEIKGYQNGAVIDRQTQVTSVTRALSALRDWEELSRILIEEVELIISNTAEGGYALDPDESTLPEGIPSSFPGKLLVLLHARFVANGRGLSIIPTELVSRNGDVLRQTLIDLARAWYADPAFETWLMSKIIMTSSLVDRIVSKALEPAGAVAEPYALWAIEAKPGLVLPCRHPAIVVADDISAYERLKLFILNLGHTILVQHWLDRNDAPDQTVRAVLADGDYRQHLQSIYEGEIIPGFADHGMGDQARAYVAATLERFANPFLDHYLRDIHQHHDEKIRRRAGGFLNWAGHDNRPRLLALLNAAK